VDYTPGEAKPISTLSMNPIQITDAQYTNFSPPAADVSHWQAYRSNHQVQLKYLGSESVGRTLQITVYVGGQPVVCSANIVA
jgi:hypothetical protein